jgi:hypothetical protein
VPELDHERSPLLLQQVSALRRQADLQPPRDQLGAGRAQLRHVYRGPPAARCAVVVATRPSFGSIAER